MNEAASEHKKRAIEATSSGSPHSADRLRLGQFLEHLLLAAGIVLFQITIDECRMYPRRGNAVAPNIVANVVLTNREC
jgi:hypothetical protein